jgi:hypothetical protein
MNTLDTFLSAFQPDEDRDLHLRILPPRGARGFPEPIATTRAKLRTDRRLQERLIHLNRTHGIYFVVNSGGDCDREITGFNAFFAEIDDRSIDEQHRVLDKATIPPAIRVETLKSVHSYWPIEGECTVETWRAVQLGLIESLRSDPKIKNPSRLMRLPFFNHLAVIDNCLSYKRIELVTFETERRFTVEEMLKAFPLAEGSEGSEGRKTHLRGGGVLQKNGWDFDIRAYSGQLEGYHERRGWAYARCPAHQGKGTTSLFISLEDGAYGCFRGCSAIDIRTALGFAPLRLVVPTWFFRDPLQPPAKLLELHDPIEPPARLLELRPERPFAVPLFLEAHR